MTVRVKAGPSAVTLCGEMLLIDSAVVMVKVNDGGAGSEVVLTCAMPAEMISVGGTVAVSCCALTKVLTSGVPFHVT